MKDEPEIFMLSDSSFILHPSSFRGVLSRRCRSTWKRKREIKSLTTGCRAIDS